MLAFSTNNLFCIECEPPVKPAIGSKGASLLQPWVVLLPVEIGGRIRDYAMDLHGSCLHIFCSVTNSCCAGFGACDYATVHVSAV